MRFIQVLPVIQKHFVNLCVNTNTDTPVQDPIAVWGLGSNSLEPNRTVLCFQLKGQHSNLSLPSFTVLFCPLPTSNILLAPLPPPPRLVSLYHSHSFYLNLFNQGLALINSWPFSVQRSLGLVDFVPTYWASKFSSWLALWAGKWRFLWYSN